MNNLNQHYRDLLGLDDAWRVDEVDLDLEDMQVVIELSHTGGTLSCPQCDQTCSQADKAPRRSWRHGVRGVTWIRCNSRRSSEPPLHAVAAWNVA